MRNRTEKGLTLTEIIIVIAIMMVLLTITIESFSKLGASKSIDTNTEQIVLELQKARSLTLASQDETQYGVHFASSSVTLFEGSSYASSATTTITTLNPQVVISNLSLTGGGNDILFDRLTGKTSENGTITVTISGKLNSTKTITVYSTGITEIQ